MEGGLILNKSKEVRLFFQEVTYNALDKLAKRVGVPKTVIVRIAVRDYLSRKGAFRND